MLYNKIENNMGVGISAAVLTGEVREAKLSAFNPVKTVPIPYHNFGLVDICDPQKEIVIEERILLYYKYDNNPVDCVKIFASIYDVKPIGFRLLQYNLVDREIIKRKNLASEFFVAGILIIHYAWNLVLNLVFKADS